MLICCAAFLFAGSPAEAAVGRIIKVLPQFLDADGRNSVSPSLYERDAYQVYLRDHPEKRSGMKFYVEWKVKGPTWERLKVRLELRGSAQGALPKGMVKEQFLSNSGGWFPHWSALTLTGGEYQQLGAVTAWRVTLWEGENLLGEQRSFLW